MNEISEIDAGAGLLGPDPTGAKGGMDYYYIMRSVLFEGVAREDVEHYLSCIEARHVRLKKGELVFRRGQNIDELGLVLAGSIRMESVDAWGEVTIHSIAEAGKSFGEAYACAPVRPIVVDIVANEDSEVLLMNAHRVMHRCERRCPYHLAVATNLTQLIALRNLDLSRRVIITAPKSIRGKVLVFLSFAQAEHGSHTFEIAFDREQMAEYLGVDRSALSAELSRMRRDGLIDYRKNRFTLLERGERMSRETDI